MQLSLLLKNLNKKAILKISIFVLILIIPLFFILRTPSNYLIDDSFISFRYARNLAKGEGLIWNLNGSPTQGYTNFFFIVLLALGFKLKIDPILCSLILNIIGLFLIQVSVFILLQKNKTPLEISYLAIFVIGLYSATFKNINSGLETVFWTGLIFLGFLLVQSSSSHIATSTFFLLLLVLTLTRPEGIIFSLSWIGILLVISKERKRVALFSLLFVFILLLYVLILNIYFGYFEPNPALVKINNILDFSGFQYLKSTIKDNLILVICTLVIMSVLLTKRFDSLLLYCIPFFLLIPFYIITDPYMGTYGRYYYPLIILCIYLVFEGSSLYLQKTRYISSVKLNENYQRISMNSVRNILVTFMFSAVLFVCGKFIYNDFSTPFTQPLLDKEMEIGKKLATTDFVSNITFAYGDAGTIPYFSNVNFIDVVGLNNNAIALGGRKSGGKWVADYVLSQRPDIIGFYSWNGEYGIPRGTIYNDGHGFIGKYYSYLYNQMVQNGTYEYIGSFDCNWIIINFFVKADSKEKKEIVNFFGIISGEIQEKLIP